MKKIAILFLMCFLRTWTCAQSLPGLYDTNNTSHTNPMHYEELVLDSGHTFKYFLKMEFIKIEKEGTWMINGDTLILNEPNPCCHKKIDVRESRDKKLPKNTIRFLVSTFQGDYLVYHLIVEGASDKKEFFSQSGEALIRMKKVRKFSFIVGSLISSPVYTIKNRKSNFFLISLPNERFFYNEKWILRDGKIVPLGFDNTYAKYYLQKRY